MSNKAKRRLCTAVFALSAIAFLYFALSFAAARKAYRHSDGDLQAVMEIRGTLPETFPAEVKSRMDEATLRAAEYEAGQARTESCRRLTEANPDMAAWITIEGTPVDYPVMHTPENPDYYYRRGFDKKYSVYGMIYMDATCRLRAEDAETVCPNYILYGHHMKNGSMFASLEKYSSEDYYRAHPVIGFDTESSSETYEIIGAVRLPAEQLNNEFAATLAARTQEDYGRFIQYVKEHSFYDTGVSAEWPEQLLTLTTCEYSQKNGRLLLVARRK